MAVRDLSPQEIQELVGLRHATTGIAFPPSGLTPYYDWLIRTLHRLAESSFGALSVVPDDATPTTVRIMPGRATINEAIRNYEGGTLELAPHNNDTALIWLASSGSEGAVARAGAIDAGWPTSPHVRLAHVQIDAGRITRIVDRRLDSVFHD
jgi:hypothetical protein